MAKQAKKGEQLVSMMPAIKKAFDLMGNNILKLSTRNVSLKIKIASCNEIWLEESELKLFKQFIDDKTAKLILS